MSRQAGFQKAHQVCVLDSIAVSVLVVILVEFAKYCQRRSSLSSMYLSMFLGMKSESEMNMIGEWHEDIYERWNALFGES